MALIEILTETEEEHGWRFAVRVSEDAAQASPPKDLTITLSWADYDLWCRGSSPPEAVAKRVIEYLLTQRPLGEIPTRFDAAKVRMWYGGVDGALGRAGT